MTEPGVDLDPAQRLVVGAARAPLRVLGGFGAGKTTALAARAERLRRDDLRPLLLRPTPLAFAAAVLGRHGRSVRVLSPAEQLQLVAGLIDHDGRNGWPTLHDEMVDPAFAPEVARTLRLYQSSFLGSEELFVHADAAGELERWEELDRFAQRYLMALRELGALDDAGVVVEASLLLRDPERLAIERSLFDDLLVDDFQLADFATARLVTQLAGRNGSVTVAGNPVASVGEDEGRDAKHFDAFVRRFGANEIALDGLHRTPNPPALHIVEDERDAQRMRTANSGVRVLRRSEADAATVGQEWKVVVIPDATADVWPSPRRRFRWFDTHVFAGPAVPSDDEREERWLAEERRRFAVATTRATQQTVLIATAPVTRFVRDLVH